MLDGVFVRNDDGGLCFHPAAPPTDADVQRVVARVRRRLERLGVVGALDGDGDVDPLVEESGALAGLAQAAVLSRAALGGRAGRRPVRIGGDPDAPWVDRHVPLHAHDTGFDLHAAVHVAAAIGRRSPGSAATSSARHSALDYLSPINYERSQMAAQV